MPGFPARAGRPLKRRLARHPNGLEQCGARARTGNTSDDSKQGGWRSSLSAPGERVDFRGAVIGAGGKRRRALQLIATRSLLDYFRRRD